MAEDVLVARHSCCSHVCVVLSYIRALQCCNAMQCVIRLRYKTRLKSTLCFCGRLDCTHDWLWLHLRTGVNTQIANYCILKYKVYIMCLESAFVIVVFLGLFGTTECFQKPHTGRNVRNFCERKSVLKCFLEKNHLIFQIINAKVNTEQEIFADYLLAQTFSALH